MAETVLGNVRLWGRGEHVNVILSDGRISRIEAFTTVSDGIEDFGGRSLLPGFAEPHVHLDKTLSIGDGVENQSSTLDEAITLWNELCLGRSQADFEARADAALRLALSKGVTYLRTHINVGSESRTAILATLEVRERWRGRIDVQLCTLGIPGAPEEDAAYRDALGLGVDVIGGSPNHAPDPPAAIRSAFKLAEEYGRPIDLHIDESENPADRYVEMVAECTRVHGLAGRVSVDHLCSLSYRPLDEQRRVAEALAAAGVNVVSLPAVNLLLQGHTRPSARGLAPIRLLLDAGVNVCLGSDNVRDPFNPLGHYDPLWQANLAVHAAHLTRPAERDITIEMITSRPADTMLLQNYGLEVGNAADLVLLDAHSDSELLSEIPARLRVWKAGKLVFRQEVSKQWL
jgi:cytosine/creatinine deaminase